MNPQQAYDSWAAQYDTNVNKTRDLEGLALRVVLTNIQFDTCLEIGCGTGKNTEWLLEKASHITAVDLSDEMLAKARAKIASEQVQFVQADIRDDWTFGEHRYDLVSFSLVLEHIKDLDPVFAEVARALRVGGHVYIGELHPFKQYAGSKARFDTDAGQQVVECFTHNLSDFIQCGRKHGLTLADADEYFDANDRRTIPRILTLLLKKD